MLQECLTCGEGTWNSAGKNERSASEVRDASPARIWATSGTHNYMILLPFFDLKWPDASTAGDGGSLHWWHRRQAKFSAEFVSGAGLKIAC
jgi:hypothetical protein